MKVIKSKDEWKKILPEDVYAITRAKGTEAPFSGKYDKFFAEGIYLCSNCDNHLFNSSEKFDSGSGWPSYFAPATEQSVDLKNDVGNMFMPDRTEVLCQNCGAHLGHVFDDGPKPTGLRYCMNSLALNFAISPTKK